MTSTGNTPAVATSTGSPPSVEGLRELLAKATPGPWVRRELKPYEWSNPQSFVCAPEALIDNGMGRTYATQILGEDDYPTKRADEDLLVAVKAALPWLLDRARAAEKADHDYSVLYREYQRCVTRAEAAEARLSALTADRDRMAEALKPFAEVNPDVVAESRGGNRVILEMTGASVTFMDFVRARQALQSDGRGE